MPIFVILITISFAFYIFYKMKFFRTQRPVEKKWISAKSSICLGLFVLFFALNTFFLHQSYVSYIVGAIFAIVGGGSLWAGFRAYKYYLPLVIDEAQQYK